MMLPGLMANLEQRAPGISLRYTDSLNLQTMDDLREARLDLILLPAGNFSPWVDWRPIFHASYVVVARQDHPVLRQHGVTPAAAMPVELYCSLRHAAFRVIEMAPDRKPPHLLHWACNVRSSSRYRPLRPSCGLWPRQTLSELYRAGWPSKWPSQRGLPFIRCPLLCRQHCWQ